LAKGSSTPILEKASTASIIASGLDIGVGRLLLLFGVEDGACVLEVDAAGDTRVEYAHVSLVGASGEDGAEGDVEGVGTQTQNLDSEALIF
jgi:hypothetical protein